MQPRGRLPPNRRSGGAIRERERSVSSKEAALSHQRFLVVSVLAAAAVLCAASGARAQMLTRVQASSVRFYYDRFLLEADGGVKVVTTGGVTLSGDAFSMDLKLNRFVLAGHVRVANSSGALDGAALADFLDFGRIYFLPVQADTPDRWTYLNGDFAHPAKGREMPGDAFALPDLTGSKPYIIATGAVVGSRSFVRFAGSRLDLANGLGAYVPVPSYYVNFSNDQHLGDNSLAGATFDATYEFAGNANAISALHGRYDTINKTYLSFEQHVSGSKAYAIFSVNPMTRPSKFWNLVLSDKPSDNFQVRSFTQLHTFQYGLQSPLESSQFTIVQATQGLPHSFVQLTTQFTNFSLIPRTADPNRFVIPDHPFQAQLGAQTFSNRIGRSPFYELLQYGLGYVHDAYGLQTIGGQTYQTVWNHSVGLQVYLPSYKLTRDFFEYKNYYLNASFVKTHTWYSSPHAIDSTTSTAGLSRVFGPHLNAFATYSVQNLGDYYANGLSSAVYVPFTPVAGGVPYPGYAAFNGVATFRTAALDVTYANSGNFSASLLARKHDDFPRPIPNFFAPPPLDVLGREIGPQNYLGQPPYDVTVDVRARINPHLSIDIARSYYFHYGNRGFSPEFVLQVMQ